ncbi:MAG: preprotein translocase subunit SecE [Gemmataceae bacterium]|nr:preprotein translocase subunit SecE [Gemmataceae bacterium]
MNFRGLFGSTAQDAANDWIWRVPFTADANYHGDFIPVLYKVHIMLPLLLSVGLIWLAWRIVNVPGFADFLIATEAEMNKVSWTSRRRLIQDTIVVLVTVVLFTGFLFVVDIIWIRVLSAPGIRVLLIDSKEEQQKQQEKAQW